MTKTDPMAAPSSGPGAAIIFNIISIVLFPISLLGYLIWVGYGMLHWRKSGVSGTAQGPLSARYTCHQLGTRQDEPANRLMLALPNVPPLGLQLTSWPLMAAHRLTGHVPKAFEYPFQGEVPPLYQASARITFFDDVVTRYLADIRQFVILGAGFDTRAYRLPADAGIRSFEIDTPKTQAVKRDLLEKTGIDSTGVTFVPADFEKDDWLKRLIESGFDPKKPALFLWEGVTIYLDREAVEDTLRKIAGTARGSAVTFDYFTTVSLESSEFYWRYARWATKAAGEPLKFGVDSTPPLRERVAELLQSCGLSLVEQRTLGQETGGKLAWGGFTVAVVK